MRKQVRIDEGGTGAEECLKDHLAQLGGTLAPNQKKLLELLVDDLIKSVKTRAAGQGDESEEMGAVVDYLVLMNIQHSTRILNVLVKRLLSEEKNKIATKIVKHEVVEID